MSYQIGIVHDDEGLRVDTSAFPNLEQYLANVPKGRWNVNGHVHSTGTAPDALSVAFSHADGRFGGSAQASAGYPAPADTPA